MNKLKLITVLFAFLLSCSLFEDDSNYSNSDDGCCKHCSKGKACGDGCISIDKECHQAAGCACD